jgi:hypothetical protein
VDKQAFGQHELFLADLELEKKTEKHPVLSHNDPPDYICYSVNRVNNIQIIGSKNRFPLVKGAMPIYLLVLIFEPAPSKSETVQTRAP